MTTILDALTALFEFLAANPIASATVAAVAASARPAWLAFMRALERRIDQLWLEHEADGQDPNQDIAVIRVRDRVKSDLQFSMLPNGVVESRVRQVKKSMPPPPTSN